MADVISNSKSYQELLSRLKSQIRTAQVRAAVAVNRELILLYWGIGKEILQRQASEGWGSKVVDRLAQDLRSEFPDMRGLSRTNLLYASFGNGGQHRTIGATRPSSEYGPRYR
jgi:predicted nuclease of restriction endonuclease-like (RecB) superfamily